MHLILTIIQRRESQFNMPFKQNKPSRNYSSVGSKKSNGNGSILNSIVRSYLGGGITGSIGEMTEGSEGLGDIAGEIGEGMDENLSATIVNQRPSFKAEHSIRDMLFNKGRAGLEASQASMALQSNEYLAKLQQDFQLKRDAILQANSLDAAQKASVLKQAEVEHAAAVANLGQFGINYSPKSRELYDAYNLEPALAASNYKFGGDQLANKNRMDAEQAKSSALMSNFPALIDTFGSNIRTDQQRASGEELRQPLVNAGLDETARMMPANVKTELNRNSFMPTTSGVMNVNTRQFMNQSPAAAKQQSESQMMQQLLGSLVGPSKGQPSSQTGAFPWTIGQPGKTNAPSTTTDMKLPDGTIIKADGTIINPDGTVRTRGNATN